MNSKIKAKLKSVRFKLMMYFSLSSLLIIGMIFVLQVFFVNYYYEQMKVSETTKLANKIVASFSDNNYSIGALSDVLEDVTSANTDLYMRVETTSGDIVLAPIYDGHSVLYKYSSDVTLLREQLLTGSLDKVSFISSSKSGRNATRTLSYACYLTPTVEQSIIPDKAEDPYSRPRYVLYIFTPLHPVQSTIDILRSQFLYITFIAIFLAFMLALFLSKRMSKPLKDITLAAAEMGKGNYGVKFKGGSYTELSDLASTLTRASHELEKTDMYQKDLIANVSHDLRTPLTMIKSYAEMIRDLSGNNPEKREAHLAVIIDEANRLNTLVTDMLNLSRAQNKSIQLEKADFNLSESAKTLIASYNILSEQEGYSIVLNCQDNIMINGDKTKIEQVISNLVTNAIKFCGEDKQVIINIKRMGRKVRCEVIDHGEGIAPDEINHVWERYYKSSTNHVRPVEGTGLGLSIVKEILTLHNAEYGVNSKVGEGSTFWFEMDCKVDKVAFSRKTVK